MGSRCPSFLTLKRRLSNLNSSTIWSLSVGFGLIDSAVLRESFLRTECSQNTGEVAWSLSPSDRREFVFRHNDLGQQNILVDPQTLKIKAIIDWEYAGFYPARFEGHFYNRVGPSFALDGERNDVPADSVSSELSDQMASYEVQLLTRIHPHLICV